MGGSRFLGFSSLLCIKYNLWLYLYIQHGESDRGRISRTVSSSKRAVVSSSRPSSSGEPSESRSNRLGSGSGRISTTQRIHSQPGFESKSSSFSRALPSSRGGRDDALRSFELLTIGNTKRK